MPLSIAFVWGQASFMVICAGPILRRVPLLPQDLPITNSPLSLFTLPLFCSEEEDLLGYHPVLGHLVLAGLSISSLSLRLNETVQLRHEDPIEGKHLRDSLCSKFRGPHEDQDLICYKCVGAHVQLPCAFLLVVQSL